MVGWTELRAQELYESRGGRPGLPSLINLRFLWTQSNTSTHQGGGGERERGFGDLECNINRIGSPEERDKIIRYFITQG